MARRAMWSGAITFGMVNIPVKLFSATNAKDISFNLIHSTCGTRVQQKRWCPTEDVEVPWEEIVRGYEYAKDQYVTLRVRTLSEARYYLDTGVLDNILLDHL